MMSSTLFECGPFPPTSTSRPPDVIYMIGVPRPSPFFALSHFRVLYWVQTKEQKWGRPGNDTKLNPALLQLHPLSKNSPYITTS